MDETYYKVLGPNGECCHGGTGTWQTDGTWMPPIPGTLAPCVRGYHLCRQETLIEHLGDIIWVAQGRGRSFITNQHLIFEEAKVDHCLTNWTPNVARLLAAECAERVLPLIELRYPDEIRPKQAIQAARDYVAEKINFETLAKFAAAAWNASRQVEGAARDVMIAAYGAAAWQNSSKAAWGAVGSARIAVAATAREHTLAAGKENNVHPREAERHANAANLAALKSEQAWQTQRLFELLGETE